MRNTLSTPEIWETFVRVLDAVALRFVGGLRVAPAIMPTPLSK